MAQPLQYQSQFVPTDFNTYGNILQMFRQDMGQRNQEFDQAVNMQEMTLAQMAEQETSDPDKQKQLIDSLRQRIEESVNKKGGDYGAAAQDISRLISKERSNPFYGFDRAKLAKIQEYGKMQKQLGLDFYADNDPNKVTMEQYLADPSSLDFKSFNKEQLRTKMRDIGKNAAELYTEEINREVADGVREIGSAKGYRTPEAQSMYLETEGKKAINDLMSAYGITDPNIEAELKQELLASIKGEKKTQYIYPRTKEGNSNSGGKNDKYITPSLSTSQSINNIRGTLPVNHPTWNLQSNSTGSIATGQTGKSSPYVNKKISGAYIPRGDVFMLGAGTEVKGGKRGTPVSGTAFADGEATYTGPMTIWRIQGVEDGTDLTKDISGRVGNAVFLGKDGRESIPGVGENEKPQLEESTGRYYYLAGDGGKKAKVYVEETPVMSFSVVGEKGAYTAFEVIDKDRDRVLGEFGTNHPLPKPITTNFSKQGDSYVVNNLRILGMNMSGLDKSSLDRVSNVTNEIVGAVNNLMQIGSPAAIEKANELTQGLNIIGNIRENLSNGRKYIMTPQEKDLLLSIEDAYTEVESNLYGRQFKISETVTPDIQ